MKRWWILLAAVAIFHPGPTAGQDEEIIYIRAAVIGPGFQQYYAIPKVQFDRFRGNWPQKVQAMRRRQVPSRVRKMRKFVLHETYYFFPLCGRKPNFDEPSIETISWDATIPIRCP